MLFRSYTNYLPECQLFLTASHQLTALLGLIECYIYFFISLVRYHSIRVKGDIMLDFKWLVQLLLSTAAEDIPRTLVFFNNTNILSDVYQYIMIAGQQLLGDSDPVVAMYQLVTNQSIKSAIITKLADITSKLRIVLCSSSLSMGMNLSGVQYVIHYGIPSTTAMFFQETGRVSREVSVHGHSILMKFARMTSGRKLDANMKLYVKGEKCLRNILLSQFKCSKPIDQSKCCDVCDDVDCYMLDLIREGYDSSITESDSDTDSVASAGEVDDLPLID